jgi:hypothetical protein
VRSFIRLIAAVSGGVVLAGALLITSGTAMANNSHCSQGSHYGVDIQTCLETLDTYYGHQYTANTRITGTPEFPVTVQTFLVDHNGGRVEDSSPYNYDQGKPIDTTWPWQNAPTHRCTDFFRYHSCSEPVASETLLKFAVPPQSERDVASGVQHYYHIHQRSDQGSTTPARTS